MIVAIGGVNFDGRANVCSGGPTKDEGTAFPEDSFLILRLCVKRYQKRNNNARTSTNPPPSVPPTMAPIGGEWDDWDWLRAEEDGDDEEVCGEMGVVVELESEPDVVTTELSTTSKSIRSIVSCEFPLAITEVSFSFRIIISWIPEILKCIEYSTICET